MLARRQRKQAFVFKIQQTQKRRALLQFAAQGGRAFGGGEVGRSQKSADASGAQYVQRQVKEKIQ